MKRYLTILLFVIFFNAVEAQPRQCGCATDTLITDVVNCHTRKLKNGAELFYQFNCDSVWLTLKTANKRKHILYLMKGKTYKELFGYTFRLGYNFCHEFDKYLLFRNACPANGPCNFTLVNKTTGKIFKELGELIYDHKTNKFYDFILYLSDKSKQKLVIYYPDKNKKYFISLDNFDSRGYAPEYDFDEVGVQNNILTLRYPYHFKKVNLSRYPK
jgi:hypothetical protein